MISKGVIYKQCDMMRLSSKIIYKNKITFLKCTNDLQYTHTLFPYTKEVLLKDCDKNFTQLYITPFRFPILKSLYLDGEFGDLSFLKKWNSNNCNIYLHYLCYDRWRIQKDGILDKFGNVVRLDGVHPKLQLIE